MILPLLPNAPLGRFHVNPFQAWLVVVAVSAVSYGSYLLQRLRQDAAACCWRRWPAAPTRPR
ncbi:Uncharacterised protein [Chromobacterium violaceum]|uniref:Uncharacterized protein n=1 Tax=Chromobacterium violaceum TaxID=536 RepID=A0A447T4S4_CHRVL|nr:Uncharacterised protein [Chromobacterium violaceum]